jgi:hypothetical protein
MPSPLAAKTTSLPHRSPSRHFITGLLPPALWHSIRCRLWCGGAARGVAKHSRTCICVCEVWRVSMVLCSSAARSAAADSSPSSPVATSCIVCSSSGDTVSALQQALGQVRPGGCPTFSHDGARMTATCHRAAQRQHTHCLKLQQPCGANGAAELAGNSSLSVLKHDHSTAATAAAVESVRPAALHNRHTSWTAR